MIPIISLSLFEKFLSEFFFHFNFTKLNMLCLAVFLSIGTLAAGGLVNITAPAPFRFSRSVGLTLLNAEDTAAVLRSARAGIDYPILETPPKTSFNCKAAGIVVGVRYADAETGCQVFHICDDAGLDTTYLCPNKTIFNDQSQVCEWFHQVDCSLAFKPSKSVIVTPITAAATAVITKPEVTAVVIPVVEAKPCTVTTCPTVAQVAVQPVEVATKWENDATSIRTQRPLAPVAVVSSAPIRPAADNTIPIAVVSAPVVVASSSAAAASSVPIRPSTDNTAPITLGTGILSNLQSKSGWGSSLQTAAPKIIAAPVARASSGWGSSRAIAVPQVAVATPVASGWGSQTQQLAAPVSTASGWGSHGQTGQSIGGFGGINPGLAGASSFFSPFAAYGSGIMNTFIAPFLGFPFNGMMG